MSRATYVLAAGASVAAAALTAGGCDSSGSGAQHPTAAAASKAPPLPGCAPSAGRPVITGGLPRTYRSSSVVVGPLAIYPARTEYPRLKVRDGVTIRHRRKLYAPVDASVTIPYGQVAQLRLARPARRAVTLLFDRSRFRSNGVYRFSDGTAQATFRGCERPYSQYVGGFLVSRRTCANVTVRTRGSAQASGVLAFGRRRC
jgi:hypothetical protein